jgi:uncharacterized protein (TIGR02466 family)
VSLDPFAPIPLFAFPVFSTTIAGYAEHRKALIDEIQGFRRDHPVGLRRSNRNDAWHSGEEFLRSRSAAITWVLQHATVYARRCLAPFYQDWAHADLRMGSYWANVLGPGGFNAPHHHFPQHWSGAFYASVPSGDGPKPDEHAGCFEILNPNPWQSTWGGGNSVHAPKEGMVLLFPASLVHYVHPHAGPGDRISIAFNFNVIPKPRA